MITLKKKAETPERPKVLTVTSSEPFSDLTEKQQRFVEEYVVDLNGTQAAIRAGYSANTANEQSSQLLAKLNVRRAVEKLQREIAQRLGLTAEKVLTEMSYLAFSNMGDYLQCTSGGDPYFDYSGTSREQRSALSEVTVEDYVEGRGDDARSVKKVKFKLHDKRSALVDLGRHMGLFKTTIEAEASVNADRDIVRGLAMLFLQKKANAIEV